MSRIPSDIFKVRNPSLGISKNAQSGQLFVTQQQSKRLTEAVKLGFVSHNHTSTSDRTPVNPKTSVNENMVKAEELRALAATFTGED